MKQLNPPKPSAGPKRGEPIRYGVASTELGELLVACSERGVCALWFGDDAQTLRADLAAAFPHAKLHEDTQAIEPTHEHIQRLLKDPELVFEGTLDLRGTTFQRRVWEALRALPVGARVSYKALASALDMPQGARAVAGACAANRIAILIPCHRVISGDGALTGYRWGVERKRWLLEQEAR